MKRRRSYFKSFPTSTLFIVLEQNKKESLELEKKLLNHDNILLRERLKQVNLVISVSKKIIIERYLKDNTSLNRITELLIESTGIKEWVFKDLFVLKILESNEPISLELLQKAIDKLEIEQLMMIIKGKQNTIYEDLATKNCDEMLFDVEQEVLKELELKKRMDRRGR